MGFHSSVNSVGTDANSMVTSLARSATVEMSRPPRAHTPRQAWDASSGGTYMWHMIECDVMSRYIPGKGRLRIVIITDGEDASTLTF